MIEFLNKLKEIKKSYFSIADLLKLTGLSRESLYVTLNRYVKGKTLLRLASGIYILPERYDQIEVIANAFYQPSYLSFESVLSRSGSISQITYTLTFATTRKTLRKILGDIQIEYRQLKPSLFFGYEKVESMFIATPEKALLDTLYFVSFWKTIVDLKNLDLKGINQSSVKRMAKKFPLRTQRLMDLLFDMNK